MKQWNVPSVRTEGCMDYYSLQVPTVQEGGGRLVQIHNLPQNHMEDLELARSIVREGRYDLVELCMIPYRMCFRN